MNLSRGVLIDLDGTLVDSVPDLAAAANRMLADLGLAAVTDDDVRRFVGNGVSVLVHRLLTGSMDGRADAATFPRAHAAFLAHYQAHLCDLSRCYDGVVDGLARLSAAGLRMACVTNKPEAPARALLGCLAIDPFFDVVIGGDTLPERKPHPLPLRQAAAELGLEVADCVMLGDSVSDIQAAAAAGCICVCLRTGYNQGLDLSTYAPDYLVDDFPQAVERVLTVFSSSATEPNRVPASTNL